MKQCGTSASYLAAAAFAFASCLSRMAVASLSLICACVSSFALGPVGADLAASFSFFSDCF